jgi:hypothetical protein
MLPPTSVPFSQTNHFANISNSGMAQAMLNFTIKDI